MSNFTNKNIYDKIIIGGGAAGLFLASNDLSGKKSLILEANTEPGRKLLISGSGACNITHGGSIKDFPTHYNAGSQIRACLYKHSNLELIKFFETKGVSLIEREDGKVFPKSMNAKDILNALLNATAKNNYEICTECKAIGITCAGTQSNGRLYSVRTQSGRVFKAHNVIIACGGASYPSTGSDGNFVEVMKRDLNLEIVPLVPALAPIFVQDYEYSSLSGISFENVEVTLMPKSGGKAQKRNGAFLFTHKGFSGPAILHLSAFAHTGDKLEINYLPEIDRREFLKKVKEDQRGCNKGIANYLSETLQIPKAFSQAITKDLTQKLSSMSGKELEEVAKRLFASEHSLSGTGGFRTAMVTAGGVSLLEVDTKTMESKKHPGIYIIGEALDVNGDTGGYNLQFAWSSAQSAREAMNR